MQENLNPSHCERLVRSNPGLLRQTTGLLRRPPQNSGLLAMTREGAFSLRQVPQLLAVKRCALREVRVENRVTAGGGICA